MVQWLMQMVCVKPKYLMGGWQWFRLNVDPNRGCHTEFDSRRWALVRFFSLLLLLLLLFCFDCLFVFFPLFSFPYWLLSISWLSYNLWPLASAVWDSAIHIQWRQLKMLFMNVILGEPGCHENILVNLRVQPGRHSVVHFFSKAIHRWWCYLIHSFRMF